MICQASQLISKTETTTPDLTAYDVILVNSSGGKDSQAMLDKVCKLARDADCLERVVVVHSDLGRVEWEGTKELAERQSQHYGVRFIVTKHSRLDLLERIEERGQFPSPAQRWCTSDFKRAPIRKVMTALANELHGNNRESKANPSKLGRQVKILNCMGLRADESPNRAKLEAFKLSHKNARRIVDDWLPIHQYTDSQVWQTIKLSGVEYHRAYDLGMPRLSCCFCIFAPKSALMIAGEHNRQLLAEYVEVEKRIDHTFKHDLALADIQNALEAGERETACESGGCWGM